MRLSTYRSPAASAAAEPCGFTLFETDASTFALSGTAALTIVFGDVSATISVPVPSAIPLPPAVYAGLGGLAMAAAYCRRGRPRQTAG